MPRPEESDRSSHPYIPNTGSEQAEMLETIGVGSVDELFGDVPADSQIDGLDLPPPMAEHALVRHYEELAAMNTRIDGADGAVSFLGGKASHHAIPAEVGYITGLGRFMTAYTPYQPEISQGTLRVAFDFQTYISELTGMEASNAGMYDGASALAEAALMSVRLSGGERDKIVTTGSIRPNVQAVVETYCRQQGIEVQRTPFGEEPELDGRTAALLIQSPNGLGYLEDVEGLQAAAGEAGAKTVVSADPLSLAMFKPPGEFDADIVVGETQPLGIAPNFGGPHLGFFTSKLDYIRQMPGRIVAKTTDSAGRDAFVLTLATREQHIRREKATSNICTSQQLIALAAAVHISLVGPDLRDVALQNYHRAHYAADTVSGIPGVELPASGNGVFFNEFTIATPMETGDLNKELLDHGVIGGTDAAPAVERGMTLTVTETHTKEDIDRLTGALGAIAEREGWS